MGQLSASTAAALSCVFTPTTDDWAGLWDRHGKCSGLSAPDFFSFLVKVFNDPSLNVSLGWAC